MEGEQTLTLDLRLLCTLEEKDKKIKGHQTPDGRAKTSRYKFSISP